VRLRLHYDIELVITMHGTYSPDLVGEPGLEIVTPALALSADVLARVVALRCSLDVDQYVLA
jgi:hypothetical protein